MAKFIQISTNATTNAAEVLSYIIFVYLLAKLILLLGITVHHNVWIADYIDTTVMV